MDDFHTDIFCPLCSKEINDNKSVDFMSWENLGKTITCPYCNAEIKLLWDESFEDGIENGWFCFGIVEGK